MPDTEFVDLFGRVQAGNAEAISELVHRFEGDVRLAVRTMLTDPALRTQFDSVDIVQSVLLRFCMRAVDGEFKLSEPAQLAALLKKIAYHRFINRVHHNQAQRRDIRRIDRRDVSLMSAMYDNVGPVTIAGWRDEYREICRRLTDEEHALAERWARGDSWVEIAGPARQDQDRSRHQLDACFERVGRQLTQLREECVTAVYLRAVFQWSIENANSDGDEV